MVPRCDNDLFHSKSLNMVVVASWWDKTTNLPPGLCVYTVRKLLSQLVSMYVVQK